MLEYLKTLVGRKIRVHCGSHSCDGILEPVNCNKLIKLLIPNENNFFGNIFEKRVVKIENIHLIELFKKEGNNE